MLTPVIRLAAYLAHSRGSAISTVAELSMGKPSSGYAKSGSVTDSPVIAATSCAMPRMERQSGLFGVISAFRMVSPR